MAGYTGETYQEAYYNFQKDFVSHVRSILWKIGFNVPEMKDIENYKEDVWGKGYFHINFKGLIPREVIYNPVEIVTLERTPDVAAERVYTNDTSRAQKFIYEHEKEESKRRLSGTTNMQGLEISNKFTIGTGEMSTVKVENETEIKVSATFEQSKEEEESKTSTETDTTEITVRREHKDGTPRKVRVTQSKFKSKIKQVDKVFLKCDVAFEVYSKDSRYPGGGWYHTKDFKRTGKHARRIIVAKSMGDFHSILKGINPRYSKQRKDWTKDSHVKKHLNAIMKNVGFEQIEESIFESASYGEVVVKEL